MTKQTLKKIVLGFVIISVIIGLFWIWWLIDNWTATKSIMTCFVIIVSTLMITYMDKILSLWDKTVGKSQLWFYLYIICIFSIIVLTFMTILSIWHLLPEDVKRKAYSSFRLIFFGAVVGWIIERRMFANKESNVITPLQTEPLQEKDETTMNDTETLQKTKTE